MKNLNRTEAALKYKMTFDYHTHTVYSHGFHYNHGKGTISENAVAAKNKGLESIAITDHGPGHKFYGLNLLNIDKMHEEIKKAESENENLRIYLGVEANIIDTKNGLDIEEKDFKKFDFVNAGYHYGLPKGNMIKNWICSHSGLPSGSKASLKNKNTDMTLRALYENKIKILTHPGDKGPFDIEEIAKACAERKTLMEISARHTHLSKDEIKKAMKYNVKFIISSDAHKPEEVGKYEEGIIRAVEAGLDISRIVNIKER